ncbi:MAG: hypothetical protein R6U57_02560 [Anaerolineales bacterium]
MKTPTHTPGIVGQMDQAQQAAERDEHTKWPRNPYMRRLILHIAEIIIELGHRLKTPTLPS